MPNPEPHHLAALADRVEAASGSDDNACRVLAREVLLVCGKGYVTPLYAWRNPLISLDAAMTLVLEGLSLLGPCGERGYWQATADALGCEYQADAATPALALTAAALRARAQTNGGSSE